MDICPFLGGSPLFLLTRMIWIPLVRVRRRDCRNEIEISVHHVGTSVSKYSESHTVRDVIRVLYTLTVCAPCFWTSLFSLSSPSVTFFVFLSYPHFTSRCVEHQEVIKNSYSTLIHCLNHETFNDLNYL